MPNTPFEDQLDGLLPEVLAAFGEPVTLHRSGVDYPLQGQFEETHGLADAGTTAGLEVEETTIELRLAELPGGDTKAGEIYRDDRLTARGKLWEIIDPQFDGEGGVVCLVHEVQS